MKSFPTLVIGALLGASIGVALGFAPFLLSPQPAGEPGAVLYGVALMGTVMFGLFGLVLGSYLAWRVSP